MTTLHLHRQEHVVEGSWLTVAATVEAPNREPQQLWYRLPVAYRDQVTDSCDPFLLALLFPAMEEGLDLSVEGVVSESLLKNLAEFQSQWHDWCPRRYRSIRITASSESPAAEDAASATAQRSILAFSGGVDSCFSALRHRPGGNKPGSRVEAGLMVHGFDIPLEQHDAYVRAADKAERILASIGIEMIRMSTNLRALTTRWEDVHGAALGSSLRLLAGGFSTGLIAASYPHGALVLPWGSNPVTDPLMSDTGFEIVHDGAEYSRLEKIERISEWAAALSDLRVCWEGLHLDKNCCECEKCIRNILDFRLLGLDRPPSFPRDVTDEQIRNLSVSHHQMEAFLVPILEGARARDITDSWVEALATGIRRNRQRHRIKKILRPWKRV